MKFIRNSFYLTGQGFISIFRNSIMSTASMLVLVCGMLIVGTFGLVLDTIDKNLDDITGLNIIVAQIAPEATADDIADMKSKIESSTVGVKVEFVSKEDGLQALKEEMGDSIDLEMYINGERENPLPDTFNVTFESAIGAEALNNYINNLEYITKTRHKIGLVEKFDTAKNGIIAIALILMAVLLVVALFVIMNTIKLGVYSRREEIAVMRYVGATNSFIFTPFLIEGVIIGIFSAAFAFGIQYYLYTYIISDIVTSYGIGNIIPFADNAIILGISFAAIGLFAGFIASGISVKRYLVN